MNRAMSRGARLLKSSGIFWLGLISLLSLAYLFITRSKIINPRNVATMSNSEKFAFRDYILSLLKNAGFTPEMSRMIFAQAAHETGNFTSDIFKENNNLFGMKLARVRKTTAIGENRGHAVYKSVEDCIADYWLYNRALNYMAEYSSVASFIRALVLKKYFEAKPEEYQTAVEKWYKYYFS
jgi:uncharacterized FlgJ-related protein